MTGRRLHLQVEFCTQGNVILLSVPLISVSCVGPSISETQLSFCWIVFVLHICYLLIILVILISFFCFYCIQIFLCTNKFPFRYVCSDSCCILFPKPFHLFLSLSIFWASSVNRLCIFWSFSSVYLTPFPLFYSYHQELAFLLVPDSSRDRSSFPPTFFLYTEGFGAVWNCSAGLWKTFADDLGSDLFWDLFNVLF